jgi:secreted PhoX family phosphatase
MRNIDDDEMSNNSKNQTFQEIVDARMSRRRFLGSGLATAAAFFRRR